MNKLLIAICTVFFFPVGLFAQQEKIAPNAGAKSEVVQQKTSKNQVKKAKSAKKSTEIINNKKASTSYDKIKPLSLSNLPERPLNPQEIEQLRNERKAVDPSHPLSMAELEALQNGKSLPVSKKEQQNRQMSPEEVQQSMYNATKTPQIPPPVPVASANQGIAQQQLSVQQNIDQTNVPRFEFVGGDTFNYGEILENNEPTPHDFEFINTGKTPLIIQEAHGSCGCTVPTFSKAPVLPGEKGIITVKYNSKGRVGIIAKDVIITSNAFPSPYTLHITGTVKSNPELYSTTPNQK